MLASELALRWDNIDFQTGKLHVRRAKRGMAKLGRGSPGRIFELRTFLRLEVGPYRIPNTPISSDSSLTFAHYAQLALAIFHMCSTSRVGPGDVVFVGASLMRSGSQGHQTACFAEES